MYIERLFFMSLGEKCPHVLLLLVLITIVTGSQGEQLFFRFPVKDKQACKKWVLFCKRQNKINFQNAVICSDHFTEDDFQRNLQSELLGLSSRKMLKPGVIPSLKLPGKPRTLKNEIAEQLKTERASRVQKREIRRRALARLKQLTIDTTANSGSYQSKTAKKCTVDEITAPLEQAENDENTTRTTFEQVANYEDGTPLERVANNENTAPLKRFENYGNNAPLEQDGNGKNGTPLEQIANDENTEPLERDESDESTEPLERDESDENTEPLERDENTTPLEQVASYETSALLEQDESDENSAAVENLPYAEIIVSYENIESNENATLRTEITKLREELRTMQERCEEVELENLSLEAKLQTSNHQKEKWKEKYFDLYEHHAIFHQVVLEGTPF